MNLRGRYEGGGQIVTAKHWWSREERKRARLIAMIREYERVRTRSEPRRARAGRARP